MRTRLVAALLTAAVAAALVLPTTPAHAAASSPSVHVSGNQLLDASGSVVRLLGVDRSGTEYACIQGWGIFDGPSDATSIAAIAAWHANAVRVPLNEDCWLGINGVAASYGGAAYRAAIAAYVAALNAAGIVAVLDLHWAAPGTTPATNQLPMPDADHAPAFWSQVAAAYAGNPGVVFDLFNEPYPDNNRDTSAAWACLRDGGSACTGLLVDQSGASLGYNAAGMQQLLSAVRGAGAANVVMSPGVQYTNALDGWLQYRPTDTEAQLAASWHEYSFNACATTACWNAQVAPVAAAVPLVTGEIGENDCAGGFVDGLMTWLDSLRASYLAWTWDTWDCASGPALITDYAGTPTGFGAVVQAHLAAVTSLRHTLPRRPRAPAPAPGRSRWTGGPARVRVLPPLS